MNVNATSAENGLIFIQHPTCISIRSMSATELFDAAVVIPLSDCQKYLVINHVSIGRKMQIIAGMSLLIARNFSGSFIHYCFTDFLNSYLLISYDIEFSKIKDFKIINIMSLIT